SLEFFEPQIVDGVKRARLPPEEVAKGAKLWEFSLVAYLVGKRLPGRSVKDILAKIWGKVGRFSIHIVENGVFIVKFEQGQARYWVLDNGPWDVWGYHLVLRKWSLGMPLNLGGCKTLPVWVKLMGVPLQYWTKIGLSYIASVLGRPLYMDTSTTNRYALSYARVCVEMDASISFPPYITLDLGDGNTMEIGVEYPWRPASCSLCQVFEHSNRNCPRATNRVWMPKLDVLALRKPEDAEGQSLWADLIHCANRFRNVPWLVLGDFNVTRKGILKTPKVAAAPVTTASTPNETPLSTSVANPGATDVDAGLSHHPQHSPIDGDSLSFISLVPETQCAPSPKATAKVSTSSSWSDDFAAKAEALARVVENQEVFNSALSQRVVVNTPLSPRSRTDSPGPNDQGSSRKKKKKGQLVWNVSGLNIPSKRREVAHFIFTNKISLFALLETKVRESIVEHVVKSICRDWHFCSNHNFSLSGRIVIMWDSSQLIFVPVFVNDQAIHGRIILPNSQKIYVSFIYGLCASSGRKQLWEDIIFCSNRFKKSPWTLLGDFNVTRFSDEHSHNHRVTKAMQDFNLAIRSAELEDLKSTGLNFTWNNMRSGPNAISKKLDRALGNWQWFKHFGDSYAHTYNPGISDHSPLSIQLMQQVQSSGRPFKFLNYWAEHPYFMKIVRQEWDNSYEGSPLRRIQLKLKSFKSQLR
ncbi:Exo_endo_phos domain-containing protein/DUF4283 domain-containing protein, partial [Cephalotus follicularis]